MWKFRFLLLISWALWAGCRSTAEDSRDPSELTMPVTLLSEWEDTGVDFVHFNDASERRLLPETMGSGLAVLDFDRDGWPDIYFVNGAPLTGSKGQNPTGQLYRNLGNGRFQNMTAGSGLDVTFYGLGVAAGDFDNDGWTDLAVTALDSNRLFRNLGQGRFQEVTEEAGGVGTGFSTGAAFFDYNRDGLLDLFVVRYIPWSIQQDVACRPYGQQRTYCTPEVYPTVSNQLFKNVDGKRFVDVSEEAGIATYQGKGLGVVVFDYNRDGWPDLAVANDTVRNFLFVNRGNGEFDEVGEVAGLAYSESGAARGGMGIDVADADRDRYQDVAIGNFSQEMVGFYKGTEDGFFVDDAAQAGIGIPTLMTTAFGTLLEDLDGDGWLDLFVLNGHIEPNIAQLQRGQSYRQPLQLFRNLGNGNFQPLLEGIPSLEVVGRGLASSDLDLDGDMDFILTQNGDRAILIRNDHSPRNWLQFKFQGVRSNRTGWGTVVQISTGNRSWRRELSSGRSYLSSSEPILTFGLGNMTAVDEVVVIWPSGERDTIKAPEINQRLLLIEGSSEPQQNK